MKNFLMYNSKTETRQSVKKVNLLSEENSEVCKCSDVMESKLNLFLKTVARYNLPIAQCFIIFFVFIATSSFGQSKTKKDTTVILISDLSVQMETTAALNFLYNFQFEKAEEQFKVVKKKYEWHPLPYFLKGLAEWWKIMPNLKETKYDDKFLTYMDSAILIAENLHKHFPEYKTEAAFFLAAAHGFKGELYADEERKNWMKAAGEGKAALKYMEVCREKNNLSPELLFGDALYNYFREWVPENYKSLKPIFWLFRHGDKKLGLAQLKEVSYNAFYTRTEAMVWLMRILAGYENDSQRALQISEYLHQTYPNNPYFHRYYARML